MAARTSMTISKYKTAPGRPWRRYKMDIRDGCQWPPWFIDEVVRFVARRMEELPTFLIEVNGASYGAGGRAWFGSQFVRLRIARRGRIQCGDYRYRDGHASLNWREIETRAQNIVYLVAHELRHLCECNRRIIRKGGESRRNLYGGELDANRHGIDAVVAWKAEWPKVRAVLTKRARKERERYRRERMRFRRQNESKRRRNTTASKLQRAEQLLAKWERERERCDRKVAKYKRSIRSLRGAMTRKRKAAAQKSS